MVQFLTKSFGMRGRKPYSHARLIVIVSFIATLLCIPWAYLYSMPETATFIGLPLVYFFNILLFPLLVLALLAWYGRKADQAERFE